MITRTYGDPDRPPTIGSYVTILATLANGVRAEAKRERKSPFEWRAFGQWLPHIHEREDLCLVVLRDLAARLHRLDGCAAITLPDVQRAPNGWGCVVSTEDARAMRLPSKAAAIAIANVVHTCCDVVPTDHDVRRTMAILADRAGVTP